MQTPTPGRQLFYCLTSHDSPTAAGQVRPAQVIKASPFGPNASPCANLSILCDGANDRPHEALNAMPLWRTAVQLVDAPDTDKLTQVLAGTDALPAEFWGKAFWPPRLP